MDWKIDRMRGMCGGCQRAFQHDQPVTSVIELDAADKACRRDLCPGCAPSGGAGRVFWESRYQEPIHRKKKVDFDRLLRLFEVWHRSPPPGHEPLLYLIALLLVRKRFLRMVDLVTRDGVEYLRLRRPGPTEQWYLAPAPLLTAADLPELRTRLEVLIDGAFDDEEMPAGGPPADVAPTESTTG